MVTKVAGESRGKIYLAVNSFYTLYLQLFHYIWSHIFKFSLWKMQLKILHNPQPRVYFLDVLVLKMKLGKLKSLYVLAGRDILFLCWEYFHEDNFFLKLWKKHFGRNLST